jgi:hypothetical protein
VHAHSVELCYVITLLAVRLDGMHATSVLHTVPRAVIVH